MGDYKGADAMSHKCRAFSGADPEDTYCEGSIVGYSHVPMYCIRKPDGSKIWWRHDLVEVYDETAPPQEEMRQPLGGGHYIIYEGMVSGTMVTEAVCYCGARFSTGNAMYGSIGEFFAAHIRRVRAEEAKR